MILAMKRNIESFCLFLVLAMIRLIRKTTPAVFVCLLAGLVIFALAAAQSGKAAPKRTSRPETKLAPVVAAKGWPQWGGPNRNFIVETKGLAGSWPPGGPRRIWARPLGEGYSGIAVDDGMLYTMYREGSQEILVALDEKTGKTVWQQRYEAPLLRQMKMENGPGPHTTPLVCANHVYAIGVTGKLHCQDRKTGKGIWYHDFLKEFDAPVRGRGYSSSPLAYKNTIILPVGGPGQAIMAFDQKDGSIAWKAQDLDWSPASPLVINVDGQDQLVVFMAEEIAGLDPNNGQLLWRHPHPTQWGLNISMPVWGEGNLLFCSSAYNGGSRVIQLSRSDGRTSVKQLWFSNRMRVHFGNAVRVGDYVYGSSGDFGPAFLTAVNVRTGQEAWRDRSFSKASFVYADGKLILVDEDGNLALTSVSPQGLNVNSRIELLQSNAWTAPSLVGTKLYVRDRKNIMALELGG